MLPVVGQLNQIQGGWFEWQTEGLCTVWGRTSANTKPKRHSETDHFIFLQLLGLKLSTHGVFLHIFVWSIGQRSTSLEDVSLLCSEMNYCAGTPAEATWWSHQNEGGELCLLIFGQCCCLSWCGRKVQSETKRRVFRFIQHSVDGLKKVLYYIYVNSVLFQTDADVWKHSYTTWSKLQLPLTHWKRHRLK